MPRVIPPSVDPDDEYFWAGVQQHTLLLQRCTDCGTLRHPPSPMCGRCHSTSWATQEAQGTGRVHSWIVSRHPSGTDEDARVVVLVELTEGVRFVSNLVDVPFAEVRNEMDVVLCFGEVDGVLLPLFRPADDAAGGRS
jgi:uncharacterized protein